MHASPRDHRFSLMLGILCVLTMIAAPPATAQLCPGPVSLAYVDLHPASSSGLAFNFVEDLIDVSVAPSPVPDCDGWFEALFEVRIPQACSRAVIWVEYEGEPKDWTLNVGDSPTNNGFGGDSGDGANAELQVLGQQLSVFSNADNPSDVDQIANASLALTDGTLKVVVGDQHVSWGQPRNVLRTPDLGRLFEIPDATGDRTIFVGVNRVVSEVFGNRHGCGVRQALVFFE